MYVQARVRVSVRTTVEVCIGVTGALGAVDDEQLGQGEIHLGRQLLDRGPEGPPAKWCYLVCTYSARIYVYCVYVCVSTT